jgi:hypothetical protein
MHFLLFLPMAPNPQFQLRGATEMHHTSALHSALVNYQVSRELLSLQPDAPFHSKLVMIPAQATVQMESTSSENGFVEVHWKNRIHKIFEADLTRLVIQRSKPKRMATPGRWRPS